ncbi:MAG: NADH:ubiquinone reductase (Na(+)-transporting) subunit E [Candidatus Margulisbacteria bacterium]|nr:NADH:ubiquinone reductase (Na(+)-transporting) subunit E [Candidatus Margulisiibacteriota bacterium]
MDLLTIFISSIFVSNIALTYFLGMCPFIAVSNDIKTAFGMGVAVTNVMTLTATLNWLIFHYFLVPFEIEFMKFIIFIVTIAASVQAVEIIIDRFFPVLYAMMGIFLPLITVNCAILGVSLFMNLREYTLAQTVVYSFSSGIGWMIAIIAMAGIRKKLRFSDVPTGLDGPGITMIIAGIIALGFMGFAGMFTGN